MDVASCLVVTKVLLAAWSLLSAAEWLFSLHLFRTDGLLSWDVLGLRPSLIGSPPIRTLFYSEAAIKSVLQGRALAGLGLLVPGPTGLDLACSMFILLSCFYVSRRSLFGGDGADQMGMVVALGVTIMSAGLTLEDSDLAFCGVLAIAGQATLAYFAAGAAKLVSPVWREGSAVTGVMQTESYGHPLAARLAENCPRFSKSLCWITIVAETLFPLVLVLPPAAAVASLACFAFFHFSNAYFMGLNAFVWSFLATYPSVMVMNSAIRNWMGWI